MLVYLLGRYSLLQGHTETESQIFEHCHLVWALLQYVHPSKDSVECYAARAERMLRTGGLEWSAECAVAAAAPGLAPAPAPHLHQHHHGCPAAAGAA